MNQAWCGAQQACNPFLPSFFDGGEKLFNVWTWHELSNHMLAVSLIASGLGIGDILSLRTDDRIIQSTRNFPANRHFTILFADDFDQYAFAAASVEFAVKDLLPLVMAITTFASHTCTAWMAFMDNAGNVRRSVPSSNASSVTSFAQEPQPCISEKFSPKGLFIISISFDSFSLLSLQQSKNSR